MKARQWMSDFLISMASLLNTGAVVARPIDEGRVTQPHSDTPVQETPLRQFEPITAKPRAPAVSPEIVAAYWQRGLDFVNFKSYGTGKSSKQPLLILPLADVTERGTQLDEGNASTLATDVDVVLLLWETDAFGRRKKPRHPLLSVPGVMVDEKLFAPRTDAAPALNPDYLAPNETTGVFAIADSTLANELIYKAIANLAADKTLNPGWDTWWQACLQVVRELLDVQDDAELVNVLAALANNFRAANLKREHAAVGWSLQVAVFASDGSGTQGMQEVYTSYLEASDTASVPLFARFCGTDQAQQDQLMPADIARLIVGHIDEYDDVDLSRPLFPLDESQRKAVCAVASLEEGELQAVNGPPGSGKTSMLRAVVASRWVSAALEQGECPIIVACGATNQSVTNVIEAFGKAPHPDSRLPYAQRWIADVPSYGAYFPSHTVLNNPDKQAGLAKFVCVVSDLTAGMLWKYRDRPNVLDPGNALDYEEQYLRHARTVLGDRNLSSVEATVEAVWKQLASTVEASDAFLRALRSDGQSWLVKIRAGLPADPTVWHTERHRYFETLIDQLLKNRSDADAAQGLVDLTFRSEAFHWAARYWEGRFLLAQRERLFSKHPLNVEASLRRLCMLTPCLVSTLHSVPTLCKVQPPADGDPVLLHRLALIDLLVIDEAGQASPELAGAALLLAKRAAVVGDLKQLSPISNHNNLSEVAVAASVGAFPLIGDIKQSRRSIADGSILAAARLTSKWREEIDQGITLCYHYRCKPSIIGFCNALSYNNTLVPRTKEGTPEPEPSMAWVSIEHEPTRVGKSFCNIEEVEHITSWVGERWPDWQDDPTTEGKPLQDIVALITAYRPQAELLRKGLEAVFDRLRGGGAGAWPSVDDVKKVTVGTVHQLQGAERPIVCLSLVEGPDQASGSFMDREPALLNVAVSRAKSSFIVFGHPRRLFLDAEAEGSNVSLAPIHFLGAYLRKTEQARLLYPNSLVIIEAGGKQRTLSSMLGKDYAVLATGGALQGLPLSGGVDIEAGLVPFPQNEQKAGNFLREARKLLESVDDVVIATDDDRMGEFIAWQVRCLLEQDIGSKPLSRVRLGAINRPSVLAALKVPGVLDERSVLAEAVRETIDNLVSQRFSQPRVLHANVNMQELEPLVACGACYAPFGEGPEVKAVGRVQAAVLRLLLDRARQTVEQQTSSRIRASVNVAGVKLQGYVLNFAEQRELTRSKDVAQIINKVKNFDLALLQAPDIIKESVSVPSAGTFSVLAEAWRRFGHLPWQSMEALQSLYDGSWSLVAESPDGFEPEQPIIIQNGQSGHPPITPLDRAASPAVLAGTLRDQVCRDIYTIIWDRFIFAELPENIERSMVHIRVDYRFDGLDKPSLGVRFEGVSCSSTTQEQLTLLLDGATPGNDSEHLKTYFPDLVGLRPTLQGESAGLWRMSLDQLLLEMERSQIGRPSTCSRSLERLIKNGLLEPPIHRGQVRLTMHGLKTALALEAMEPELSTPDFCTSLAARLGEIEAGAVGPRDVLGDLLPLLVPDHSDTSALRAKIWNSLGELKAAQARRAVLVRGGGLITAPIERGQV